MSAKPKLTKAQADLLHDLVGKNQHIDTSYKPAKKLVELGLAVWLEGKWGSSILQITDAGRRAGGKS